MPWHVARLVTRLVAPLVVDYFDYAARPDASAHRTARHSALRTARCRLLHLRVLQPLNGSSSHAHPMYSLQYDIAKFVSELASPP
jgi:hypothetical protein